MAEPLTLLNYAFVAIVFSLLLGAGVSQRACVGLCWVAIPGLMACVGTKLLRTYDTVDELTFYASYHSHPMNQLVHIVCVPLLLWLGSGSVLPCSWLGFASFLARFFSCCSLAFASLLCSRRLALPRWPHGNRGVGQSRNDPRLIPPQPPIMMCVALWKIFRIWWYFKHVLLFLPLSIKTARDSR